MILMQKYKKTLYLTLLIALSCLALINRFATNPNQHHLEPPTVNWPDFVIIGKPFTITGDTPIPESPVRAIVTGVDEDEGNDYTEEAFSDADRNFTITFSIPYPYYDFQRRRDNAGGYEFYLKVEWGYWPGKPYGNASKWIRCKPLSEYTLKSPKVRWPEKITIGEPFIVSGTTPVYEVPVRVLVYGSGLDSGNDYVEETSSDEECRFNIAATIPLGWHFSATTLANGERLILICVTWGYWPIEPYGGAEKWIPYDYSGKNGDTDGVDIAVG